MCLTHFPILKFLRIVVRPGQYHTHILVLDHLPPSIEFLTFELFWSLGDALDTVILELNGDYVEQHVLSHPRLKIRVMPARRGADFSPDIETFLRDRMPRLHSTDRIIVLRYRQTLDGEGIMYV